MYVCMYACMHVYMLMMSCVRSMDGVTCQIINSFLCIHVWLQWVSPPCSVVVVQSSSPFYSSLLLSFFLLSFFLLSSPLLSSPLLSSPLLSSPKLPFPPQNHMVPGERCKLRQTLYPLRICSTSRGIHNMTLSRALSLALSLMHSL